MQATVLPFPIMTNHLDTYPNRIRELRLARGWSQEELGELCGMSGVQVGYLELGRRELKLSTMKVLARVFEISTAEILSREDNPLMSSPRSRRLLENWSAAEESGRQAIERVAESMTDFRHAPALDSVDRIVVHAEPVPEKRDKQKARQK